MNKKMCPAGNIYEFVDIRKRVKRKAVRCLFKGNVYDTETIQMYCLGYYQHCPVYRNHIKDKEDEEELSGKIKQR